MAGRYLANTLTAQRSNLIRGDERPNAMYVPWSREGAAAGCRGGAAAEEVVVVSSRM